jgi:hypothetical protein
MAEFFKKLDDRGRGSDFFSSHPNPENRIQKINVEIDKLGPFPANPVNDTSEFRSIRQLLKSLPPAPKATSASQAQQTSAVPNSRPPSPSSRYRDFNSDKLRLRHPDNWQSYGSQNAFTIAPEGGIIGNASNSSVAYGVMTAVFTPSGTNRTPDLKQATDQLAQEMQSSNSGMRLAKDQGQIRVGGQKALSRLFVNDSPVGGRETDWLVTVARPEGLVYFVFIAPEQEFSAYQEAFQQIIASIRFK